MAGVCDGQGVVEGGSGTGWPGRVLSMFQPRCCVVCGSWRCALLQKDVTSMPTDTLTGVCVSHVCVSHVCCRS